jgi:hypothetical protein
MQEPEAIILPDGSIVTKNSDESLLHEILVQIGKKRWGSWIDENAGTDAAAIVASRWSCSKHGWRADWNFEESGIAAPIQLKRIRPNRICVRAERGLLCIFDPETYQIKEDLWEDYIENLKHLVSLKQAVVCDLGEGNNFDTAITTEEVKVKAFRTATAPIICSNGRLSIGGGHDLFFYRPEIPHMMFFGLEFDLEPGPYICSISQIRPPDVFELEHDSWLQTRNLRDPEVIVQFHSPGRSAPACTSIIWDRDLD